MKKKQFIKLLDIQFERQLVSQTAIADKIGFTPAYVNMLCAGTRKDKRALKKVRDAVVELYTNCISYIPIDKQYSN